MKKFLVSLAVCLAGLACLSMPVYADANLSSISKYDVDMKVNSNNSFDITEKISAVFEPNSHGIKREIPTVNSIARTDGSKAVTHAIISNFNVMTPAGTPFSESDSGSDKVYKIGSSNSYVNTNTDYALSYHYDLGEDNNPKFDELYFNLIGDKWSTYIRKVTFRITMPKDFDASKLGFSYGGAGSMQSGAVSYSLNGTVITGQLNQTLSPNQALTVRLQLPEGYFTGERQNKAPGYLIPMMICIGLTILGLIIWYIFGRDKKCFPTVEFYPPNGYNSAETQFLLKGTVDSKGMASLIVYLASKGYLKIKEIEKQILFTHHNSFELDKLKEYDGDNEVERTIFHGLFERRDIIFPEDLTSDFKLCVDSAKKLITSKENKYTIFEKSSVLIKPFVLVISIIMLIGINLPCVYETTGTYVTVLFPVVFPSFGLAFLFTSINRPKKDIGGIIFSVVWTLGALGMMLPFLVIQPLIDDPDLMLFYVVGFVCSLILIFLWSIMSKRTDLGIELLGKVKGFKKFLEVAEKDNIDTLVAENPEYFFDIMPYAYALGVTDKWIDRFGYIAMEQPSWYESTSGCVPVGTFYDSFSSVMDGICSSSAFSSSSGGLGGSGGGSSGGGSGGGGGSGW